MTSHEPRTCTASTSPDSGRAPYPQDACHDFLKLRSVSWNFSFRQQNLSFPTTCWYSVAIELHRSLHIPAEKEPTIFRDHSEPYVNRTPKRNNSSREFSASHVVATRHWAGQLRCRHCDFVLLGLRLGG